MERVRRKQVGKRRCVASALLASTLAACGGASEARLVVRTDLPDDLRDAVEASFEARHPDIDLRFSEASVDVTLEELESGRPGFDIWWGAPARVLLQADALDAFTTSEPSWAPAGAATWHPWLTTPLVIAFDRTTVALSDAPSDWIDVFHHAWYDDVRVPDPASTQAGAALVGGMVIEALRDDDDVNRGFDWLTRLHDQVDVYVTELGAAVDALRRGDALLAVMARAEAESLRDAGADWLHYRIPSSGTPELVLGVGVVAGSEVTEAAGLFLDHLGSDEVATSAKLHTHWEPLIGEVDGSGFPPDFELPQSWRGFTPAFDTLAVELEGWVDRWEREVRTR